MEIESVNGKANAGVTLGIIGTALSVLSGGMGMLNANGMNSPHSSYVTKDEMNMIQSLAAKDSEIALLTAENNTEAKMIEVYKQAHSEILALRDTVNANYNTQQAWNASQSVANAQLSSTVATNTASISALSGTINGITKTIVPISSVCPEPMKLYNSWTAPTSTTTTS